MSFDETAAVYGELYKSANTQMSMVRQAIDDHRGAGFESDAQCSQWAKENLLDIIALGKAQHQFYYVSHKGEILTKKAWIDYYCNDVLFVWDENEKGKRVPRMWSPSGFTYFDNARINGEIGDGVRDPLYHRDYFTPTGYYDNVRGTFNSAKPFPVAARETGRDTSHIYTFIEHIAGECSLHLLAWLRTKMLWPTQKTQVVPVIVSRAQGTGKTTFAEIICKGLFGKDNVLVTDQYDSQSRFNADYADALIVCHEEKEEVDRRNSAATIKSRATATTIRKEYKGLDPIYQESYTEFIMTSNRDVPIKFDGMEDQRRFMIMEADATFTRKTSELADEVFTKLYGQDADSIRRGVPFAEDHELIAQFKHELYSNEDIKNVKLRNFPKTAAYQRCFTLPRTTENTEIEAILRSMAPFIREALLMDRIVTDIPVEGTNDVLVLSHYTMFPGAIQYVPAAMGKPKHIALCRPLIFYDSQTNKPFNHANVERGIYDCDTWLQEEFGIKVYPDMTAMLGGFIGIQGRHRSAPAARFMLADDVFNETPKGRASVNTPIINVQPPTRLGERLRVNGMWKPDPLGEFETVNEMKPGVKTLENKNQNVQYMDTFLFEADETSKSIYMIEENRLKHSGLEVRAEKLFTERLNAQRAESASLFRQGIAARIVYSGGKSYHIIVRVKDEPSTLDEYKWLHAQLANHLSRKLSFDPTTADPARLTRAPITFEREFEYHGQIVHGTQCLIDTNWNNVYGYEWRPLYQQWLNRPLYDYEATFGRKLRPSKPEYHDAMSALLHGTFWSDSTWHGRRQQCFFPGYRLCRILGYSHDQLWNEGGILDGVDSYYRKNEIQYWRSRESSDIIRQIDDDVDSMEAEA